jgi:predicted O-methyltransferase YrrM
MGTILVPLFAHYRPTAPLVQAAYAEGLPLLYMLARSTGARTIVEFGTSFGISTLHLAAALRTMAAAA